MATPLHMKRMAKERATLEKPNNDYFVHFEDDNLLKFDAYVFGPVDTPYAHKLAKLRFEIPERYPLVPPKCTFVQHSGGRMHPNLYVEGKVCLSILGTWPGEPWALAMTVETVLITVRSLLDDQPYKHEPGCANSAAFNDYVRYTSWKCMLLDYLKNEVKAPARAFLERHISQHGSDMLTALKQQACANCNVRQLTSPYMGRARNNLIIPNYQALLRDLEQAIGQCCDMECSRLVIEAPLKSMDQGEIVKYVDETLRQSTQETSGLRSTSQASSQLFPDLPTYPMLAAQDTQFIPELNVQPVRSGMKAKSKQGLKSASSSYTSNIETIDLT